MTPYFNFERYFDLFKNSPKPEHTLKCKQITKFQSFNSVKKKEENQKKQISQKNFRLLRND